MDEFKLLFAFLLLVYVMIYNEYNDIEEEEILPDDEIENLQKIRKLFRRRRIKILLAYKNASRRHKQIQRALISDFFRRKHSVWTRVKPAEWWEKVVSNFTDEDWLSKFRMSLQTFEYLCQKLRPAMERQNTSFRLCVPLRKRVAMSLWKLATNSEYRSIGILFGVGLTTVWSCFKSFCAAVNELLLPELICIPNQTKMTEMANYFEWRWGVPYCIGAIGELRIPTKALPESHCDYLNGKGGRSVILQAVVDGKGLFWYASCESLVSVDVAGVLRGSELWQYGRDGYFCLKPRRTSDGHNMCYYLIGDAAYPLQPWLVKPYEDTEHLTAVQQTFNHRLSRATSLVENAFSRLKGRWHCMRRRDELNVELRRGITVACCVLHNLCEKRGENFSKEWVSPPPKEPEQLLDKCIVEDGTDVREGLLQHFMSQV